MSNGVTADRTDPKVYAEWAMPPPYRSRRTALQRLVAVATISLAGLLTGLLAGSLAIVGPAPLVAADSSPTPIPNPFDEPVGGDALGGVGVVAPGSDVAPVPDTPATSFVVANLTTREVLAAKNAHESLEPGSGLTMLMGLTLLDRLDPNAIYTTGRRDVVVDGDRVGLQVGGSYSVDELFYGLFLRSGNDAAAALTRAAGGADYVVGQMNERAARLGAFDTTAADGTTLESPDHRSSAYDLAVIAAAGLENEDFVRYTGATSYAFPRPAPSGEPTGADVGTGSATEPPDDGFRIENDNTLLADYPDATGVFADPAAGDLPATIIGVAERDGQRLLVVVMRAEPPAGAAATDLLDWGFEVVESAPEPVGELVTPADVAEALGVSGDPSAQPSGPAPTNPDGTTATTAPPAGDAETAQQDASSPFSALGLDPPQLMLLGLAVLFTVLAGTRVRTVLRDRHAKRDAI